MNSVRMVVFALASSFILVAGQGLCSDVFAEPKNLRVLPKDISRDDLRKTMLGFSGALNARCSYSSFYARQPQAAENKNAE